MKSQITILASESSLAKRHTLNIESALATSVTTSFCFWVFSEFSTAFDCLVGEQLIESAPTRIQYVFSEIRMNHSFNIQFLATDYAIVSGEGVCEFVQEIVSLVGDFLILPSQLNARFLSVVASFDSFGMNSLESCEFPFCIQIESGVGNSNSLVVSEESFQSYINPDFSVCVGVFDFNNFNFTAEYCEPLHRLVLFDGEGFDFSFRNPVQDYGDTAYSGDLQSLLIKEFESALWIGDASDSAFETRKALLPTSFFASVEEVAESLAQPIADILQDLGINFLSNFGIADFQINNKAVKIIFVCCPEFFVESEKFVIDEFAVRENIVEPNNLLRTGIYPIFEHHFLNNHNHTGTKYD